MNPKEIHRAMAKNAKIFNEFLRAHPSCTLEKVAYGYAI
jgi:hypothetical protein